MFFLFNDTRYFRFTIQDSIYVARICLLMLTAKFISDQIIEAN